MPGDSHQVAERRETRPMCMDPPSPIRPSPTGERDRQRGFLAWRWMGPAPRFRESDGRLDSRVTERLTTSQPAATPDAAAAEYYGH